MSIQAYTGPSASANHGAIVPVGGAQELTQEEYEKRQKDAAELEEKLKFITEKVPTRICQVMGSNAGAGSGEFHMYRMARRREMMRQDRMEEEAKQKDLDAEFEAKQAALRQAEEEKTAKRRAKRMKKKTKRRKKAGADGDAPAAGGTESEQSDDEGVEQVGLD
ncbi:probable PRKR-interacting protein 1 [Coccomyxa sp. Obi]|nr:probable PRKR-interacting protein 1 [Coccomyxa sp. Obi]